MGIGQKIDKPTAIPCVGIGAFNHHDIIVLQIVLQNIECGSVAVSMRANTARGQCIVQMLHQRAARNHQINIRAFRLIGQSGVELRRVIAKLGHITQHRNAATAPFARGQTQCLKRRRH